MRRVLIITPFLIQGGVEHSLVTALKAIDPEKYQVTLYLYVNKLDLLPQIPNTVNVVFREDKTKYQWYPKVILWRMMRRISHILHSIEKEKRYSSIISEYIHEKKVQYPLKHYFRNKSYDVVVSYSVHIGTETAIQIPCKKHIVFIHSSDPTYHLDIIEKTFSNYDEIVTVSPGVKEAFLRMHAQYESKTSVLENYVDANELIRKSEFPLPFPVQKRDVVLCTCGRLSREKGHLMAVHAAAILKEKDIDFVWYFIGDGDQREKVSALIEQKKLKDEVVITGFSDNPFPIIKNCDIYVQPSYEEAYGLTIGEAQILGKAIVSTDTVGGRYILKNGQNGVLARIDALGLAEGILTIVNDIEKRKSFENLYTVSDNEKEKQVYIEKWEQLLG